MPLTKLAYDARLNGYIADIDVSRLREGAELQQRQVTRNRPILGHVEEYWGARGSPQPLKRSIASAASPVESSTVSSAWAAAEQAEREATYWQRECRQGRDLLPPLPSPGRKTRE
jgi:hypothetical protein